MLLATFRIDLEGIALAATFDQLPDLEAKAERIAAHGTEWTMPCFWASSANFKGLDVAIEADPSVNSAVEATVFADEKYYQLEWADCVEEGSTPTSTARRRCWQRRPPPTAGGSAFA